MANNIKCVIIDDERNARVLLQNILNEYCDNVEVLALCDDLPNGIKAIHKYKPDLVLLDIEMPGHSGLEILDFFDDSQINFEIIFCTGYSEYAIQAFKLSALDYLLKPIDPSLLIQAIHRFEKKELHNNTSEYRLLQQNLNTASTIEDKCIAVSLSNSVRFIKVNDIVMLKAEGSYAEIYLSHNEKLLASKNLKHFEEKLLGIDFFFRSHKSYLINLKYVNEYVRSENTLYLTNKLIGMVSTDKSETLMQKMESLC